MQNIDLYQPIFGLPLMEWFTQYGYFILLPLMMIEGRIVSFIAAALAELGFLNIFYVYALTVLAGLLSDIIYYLIGRYGRKVVKKFGPAHRVAKRIRYSKGGHTAANYLDEHGAKTFFFTKALPSVSWPLQIVAGAYHMDFKRYFLACGSADFVWGIVSVGLGYFVGYMAQRINLYAVIALAALIIAGMYYLGKYGSKRFAKEVYGEEQ